MLHNEEDKKQKYGFDFASDNSPPNLIFIEPTSKNEVNENCKTSEEQSSTCEKICFSNKTIVSVSLHCL